MILSREILDNLCKQAQASPRQRKNHNLHESTDDAVQRFFNAMEPGTIVPIHRHRDCIETFILIRGKTKVQIFDDNKKIIEETLLAAGSENFGVHIPKGVWHSVEVLEPDTVTFEVKEGPYAPLAEGDIMPL